VKVFQSAAWRERLIEFSRLFLFRRGEFEQVLVIHTTSTVMQMQVTTEIIAERVLVLHELFKTTFVPDPEVKLTDWVNKNGGTRKVSAEDTVFAKAVQEESSLAVTVTVEGKEEKGKPDLAALKEEVHISLDLSVEQNRVAFENKFKLLEKQVSNLFKAIQDGNNRVIKAVKEGPHERIRHKALRGIWQEMNWRSNVKARLFVMTLRDHLRDPRTNDQNLDEQNDLDNWTLEFINFANLPAIMEAFDDDGSGYISIAEINTFTDFIPEELQWSLQHWIAYWSIGWRMSAQKYQHKIHKLFAIMFALLPKILPENYNWAHQYLSEVWEFTTEITMGLRFTDVPTSIWNKFQRHVEMEEEEIQSNLEGVGYNIDELNTVHAVTGPGRVEKARSCQYLDT